MRFNLYMLLHVEPGFRYYSLLCNLFLNVVQKNRESTRAELRQATLFLLQFLMVGSQSGTVETWLTQLDVNSLKASVSNTKKLEGWETLYRRRKESEGAPSAKEFEDIDRDSLSYVVHPK